jgi:hypothetical protein
MNARNGYQPAQNSGIHRSMPFGLVALVFLPFIGQSSELARSAVPLLKTARQIQRLSRSEANKRYPAELRGVITFRDENGFFLRDATGVISVDTAALSGRAKPGDLVIFRWTTVDTGFAPVLSATEIAVLGRSPIGRPLRPTFQQMASTELDSQWISIEGVVHSALLDEDHSAVDVDVGDGRVVARVSSMSAAAAARLVDARVVLQGNCGAIFNERNQWVGVRLYVPGMEWVRTKTSPMPEPFAVPLHMISELRGYNMGSMAGHRVRIRGIVTFNGVDGLWASRPLRTVFSSAPRVWRHKSVTRWMLSGG